MVERGFVAEGGVVVVEHSKRRQWPERLGKLSQASTRRHGDTCVTVYS
jgi:hypothetical protein